jgi:protoheme IX farnesyltransferase
MLPWLLGYAGWSYGFVALTTGAIMVALAWRLYRAPAAATGPAAKRLFALSILYLFVLFATLLIEQSLVALVGRAFA